jgi:hypothetical protein
MMSPHVISRLAWVESGGDCSSSSACSCERELGGVVYSREEGGDGDNERG